MGHQEGFDWNAETLYAGWFEQILRDTVALQRPNELRLVGIRTGGEWLAERLRRDLQSTVGAIGEIGVLNHAFHRDDLRERGLRTGSNPTSLPFEINGADILLIDDVLFSGRTVRAAINELFDYGRPARVRLAVLVDRGGRQLPFAPDFCALQTPLAEDRMLRLRLDENGRFRFDLTVIEAKA